MIPNNGQKTTTEEATPRKLKHVGDYQLSRTLGQGTFGKVKYAINTRTNTPVAVKMMDKSKIRQAKMGAQIKKEIRVMKMLNHKTCIKLIEVLASTDVIFIVCELVTGGELFDRIVANGRFSEAEARNYFVQLIEGLEHCHSIGICHRDLKPENLLLDSKGGLKITDFGLSSINEDPSEPQVLHTPCGTPNYVAPEVLMEKGYDGTLADVWSAGVILYLLVSGFLPFDEQQMVDLFRKIVCADYQYPSWLSQEVQALIGRMLEPDPNRRATIAEIKESAWYRGIKLDSNSSDAGKPSRGGYTQIVEDENGDIIDEHDQDEQNLEDDIIGLTLSPGHLVQSTSDVHYDTETHILTVNGQPRDVREWFHSKYPGRRSVIDDKSKRNKKRMSVSIVPSTSTTVSVAKTTSGLISGGGTLSETPDGSSSHNVSLPTTTSGNTAVVQTLPTSTNDGVPPSAQVASVERPSSAASTKSQANDDEDNRNGPRILNAFDLINMVSGQSMNNMLLFTPTSVGGAANSSATASQYTAPNSITQFTARAPIHLLMKRLDWVLLHLPNAKYRINYRKCHINVLWTNSRNHRVSEYVEIYHLTADLHMVRCQRMADSALAHHEFFKLLRDSVKNVENKVTEATMDDVFQEWSRDFAIYKSDRRHRHQLAITAAGGEPPSGAKPKPEIIMRGGVATSSNNNIPTVTPPATDSTMNATTPSATSTPASSEDIDNETLMLIQRSISQKISTSGGDISQVPQITETSLNNFRSLSLARQKPFEHSSSSDEDDDDDDDEGDEDDDNSGSGQDQPNVSLPLSTPPGTA